MQDAEWRRLVQAMGSPERAGDPALAATAGRLAQAAAIDARIAAWTRGQQARPLMERLQKDGIRAGAVQNVAQVLADLQFATSGLFATVDHPDGHAYPLTLNPWTFDGLRHGVRRPAPALGQDNEYLLHDLLGLSRDQLRELTYQQLIGRIPIVGE